MVKRIYDWKRFWCPREATFSLTDGGYLSDPDQEWGNVLQPDVVSFEKMSSIPCLVLLGEPGIGKTSEMEHQYRISMREEKERGNGAQWIDLKSFQTDARLGKTIFENDIFQAWLKGSYRLELFLDSLDECLLRIDSVASFLIEELKSCPVERLAFRIACRTREWPIGLEQNLQALWKDEALRVYELVPLRRIDVHSAVRAFGGLEPDAFMQEISERQAVPLAIKPVTLAFLLNTFQREHHLPTRQIDLYREGCRILCEESSQSRRDSGQVGDLSASQRLAVAGRIAAVTLFCNRFAVWMGIDLGDVPDEDIVVKEIAGGTEVSNGEAFTVGEASIVETLGTGLFSSRGPYRMSWAHKTYSEFLAAEYLSQKGLGINQITSLIFHPDDPQGKLIPQLHEMAAWIAGMLPEIFRIIMKRDPEVLLRSDVTNADISDRIALLDNLLFLYDTEQAADRDFDIRHQYRKFSHPDLAQQLRPYICDSTKGIVVRRVAIQIARACNTRELQSELLDIALNPSEFHHTRVNAACSLIDLADEKIKLQMKKLAVSQEEDDPDDQLKGAVLLALWPDQMSASEVLSSLTPPKKENLFGIYQQFISFDFAKKLKTGDLGVALAWVAQTALESSQPFETLKDEIIAKAWDAIDSSDVLDAFCSAILARLKRRSEIIGRYADHEICRFTEGHEERRRKVVARIIGMLPEGDDRTLFWLAHCRTPLIVPADVLWLIAKIQHPDSEKTRPQIARVIRIILDWTNPDYIDAIASSSLHSPAIYNEFEVFLKAAAIDSPEAAEMKKAYDEQQEWQDRRSQHLALDPPPDKRIATLLNEFENGSITVFPHITLELTLEPNSTMYRRDWAPDLTTLPGWENADEQVRTRIVEAAMIYVRQSDPESSRWSGGDTWPISAVAGYKALCLLLTKSPSAVATLASETWRKWASVIMAYPDYGSEEQLQKEALVCRAYEHAPDEIINTLSSVIEHENTRDHTPHIIDAVEACWNARVAETLLNKIKQGDLKPTCLDYILGKLLQHEDSDSRKLANSFLDLPISSDATERKKAISAAVALLCFARDAGWTVVWPVLQQNPVFGRDVFLAAVHGPESHEGNILKKLSENQLADLFIWLVHQFPYSEDPEIHGAVGPRGHIGMWKETVLSHLVNRGNYRAVEATQYIARSLPSIDWLKWRVQDAQALARSRTWTPCFPSHILQILSDSDKRLVQSGEQLLDLALESLLRLDARLQGETPAAIDLWNEIYANQYRPKDENRISDYAKRYLDEDLRQRGIVVNREVEVRRGQKTDIRIDALIRRGTDIADRISVIIETKGCWNPELETAMETQLLNRYMKDNQCLYGLYLVGWFNCDKWDKDDYRKSQSPKYSLQEAKLRFHEQAQRFSQNYIRMRAFVLNIAI
jgi:predicted NACHT family NTPase